MANKQWRKKQGDDKFFKKAKAEGYRARSAYKFQEINQKFKLVRRGNRVLDIGAAPGSWSQVVSQMVGPQGHVVAVDLQPIQPLPGVSIIQGDIREPHIFQQIQAAVDGKPFDAVISDIAPNTTGVAFADHARSIELSLFSLSIALHALRPGGNFVTKVFSGADFDDLFRLTKKFFGNVRTYSPEATRKESKEAFIIATALTTPMILDPNLGLPALLQGQYQPVAPAPPPDQPPTP